MMIQRVKSGVSFLLLTACLLFSGCTTSELFGVIVTTSTPTHVSQKTVVSLADIPAFSDSPYVVINGNEPYFEAADLTTTAFEEYGTLDALGRCGVVWANVCPELMPTEDRGEIGHVKPTGWQSVKYDCVDGKYLYNRCHLIGFQLTGENATKENLITGTRYLNVDGMLPFENMVADYVKETGNHVLYRVTPIFDGDNLVADGVLMEATSVEDEGEGICFNVYCYNVQPGVTIDYATGESQLAEVTSSSAPSVEYVINKNSKKFHLPSCSSAEQIDAEDKLTYNGSRSELVDQGYHPCGRCKP